MPVLPPIAATPAAVRSCPADMQQNPIQRHVTRPAPLTAVCGAEPNSETRRPQKAAHALPKRTATILHRRRDSGKRQREESTGSRHERSTKSGASDTPTMPDFDAAPPPSRRRPRVTMPDVRAAVDSAHVAHLQQKPAFVAQPRRSSSHRQRRRTATLLPKKPARPARSGCTRRPNASAARRANSAPLIYARTQVKPQCLARRFHDKPRRQDARRPPAIRTAMPRRQHQRQRAKRTAIPSRAKQRRGECRNSQVCMSEVANHQRRQNRRHGNRTP